MTNSLTVCDGPTVACLYLCPQAAAIASHSRPQSDLHPHGSRGAGQSWESLREQGEWGRVGRMEERAGRMEQRVERVGQSAPPAPAESVTDRRRQWTGPTAPMAGTAGAGPREGRTRTDHRPAGGQTASDREGRPLGRQTTDCLSRSWPIPASAALLKSPRTKAQPGRAGRQTPLRRR